MITPGVFCEKLFYLAVIAVVAVVSTAATVWYFGFVMSCDCETTSTGTDVIEAPEKGYLNLYRLNNQLIGYCDSEHNVVEIDIEYQTIIVMDRSGSMGSEALRLVQNIFPLFFRKLSYKPDNTIHLITFDSISELLNVTVEDFPKLPVSARGGTMMARSVEDCQKVFTMLDSDKPVRLLTISDGMIGDQIETSAAASTLNNYLRSLDPSFTINSKAVRLFTSGSQPDTTAISSLLQLNNGPSSSLVDISVGDSDDVMAEKIAELFVNDNFNRLRTIDSPNSIFKKFPWNDQITSVLKLAPGENVFWMTEVPKDGLFEKGAPAKFVVKPQLNADRFEKLIRSTFDSIVEEIKVLQILNSVEGTKIIDKIKQYFQTTLPLLPTGVRNISNMAVFVEIEKLVNNQNVKYMSPQEKADYLKTKIVLPPLDY